MAGSGRKKKDNDWGSWALIVFLFAIQLWPVALFLLFAKLFGSDAKQKQELRRSRRSVPARDKAPSPARPKRLWERSRSPQQRRSPTPSG